MWEILNGKLHFLFSLSANKYEGKSQKSGGKKLFTKFKSIFHGHYQRGATTIIFPRPAWYLFKGGFYFRAASIKEVSFLSQSMIVVHVAH